MTNRKIHINTFILFGLVFLISNFSISTLNAQITKQSISFKTPKVALTFHPSLQQGINSNHKMVIELPRLNLIVNLFENYMQYLNKIQKIATGTSLRFDYSPGQTLDSSNYDADLILINDLGLNSILNKVNTYLKSDSFTKSSFLLDNIDSLFTIPDNFPREEAQVVEDLRLTNLSDGVSSLEPESSFCVVSSSTTVVTRPFKQTNRIILLKSNDQGKEGKVLLKQGRKNFRNLLVSSNQKYLAFTEGHSPNVLNMQTGEVKNIFDNKNATILLHMAWSPHNSVLAGMILHKRTQERAIFIFDASSGERLKFIEQNTTLEPNYLFAPIFWSYDGTKFLITSGKEINLIDVKNKKIKPSITRLPNNISELIWSPDNKSFAVVEIVGQARDKYIFDDLDFRKSILHSFHLSENEEIAMEDQAQRAESRNTIKLITYWTLGRILYVEGRLISKKLNTPIWDMSKSFSAKLTSSPGFSLPRGAKKVLPKTEALKLPMKYLYVFKNLDGKYKNIYDSGYGHTNHVYLEGICTHWFIGLRKPDDIETPTSNWNLRTSPYPFVEENEVYFHDMPGHKLYEFLKLLQEYDLRYFKIAKKSHEIWLLANFNGPINLWLGNAITMITELNSYKASLESDDDGENTADGDDEEENNDDEDDYEGEDEEENQDEDEA